MRTHNNRLNSIAAAILLGMSLAVPATAGAVQSNAHSNIETNTLANIRIDNFGRVNADYYRGAQPTGHDYADLQAVGIKTVIDLTDDGDAQEAAIVQGLGMKFYRIPMTTHETPSAEKVHEFLTLVNDPANQPVYVHCQGGRHRTGVMTAVYRMADEGWTADRAFAEMKQYKFGMDFLHPEFKDFVMAFHPALDMVPAVQTVAELKPSPSLTAANAGN
jgi:tyrosine-protein phosphatase SIW14